MGINLLSNRYFSLKPPMVKRVVFINDPTGSGSSSLNSLNLCIKFVLVFNRKGEGQLTVPFLLFHFTINFLDRTEMLF